MNYIFGLEGHRQGKDMPKKLVIPVFKSEAEDAAWHQKHKSDLEREMAQRLKVVTTLSRTQAAARVAPKQNLRPVTIRLAIEDINMAREVAARKGIGYHTCIRILLREALERHGETSGRSLHK